MAGCGASYFFSRYDKDGDWSKVAAAHCNTEKGDGVRFHGRRYVQLTGRSNYRKAGRFVGSDLVTDPNLALDPVIAGGVLFMGTGDGPLHREEAWRLFPLDQKGLDQRPQDRQQYSTKRRIADDGKRLYGAISYTTGP